ncbi:response regulator transcription factor [Pseudoclavibacter caeni]|uniref:Response regulator transcription factor n=1 Tax=Pseudoclavibacter caeni TaxID=908846 RepID=A0A7C8BNY5_9MICO|nr:response regulator transcription factor [Pseudoclavibacter caeni]
MPVSGRPLPSGRRSSLPALVVVEDDAELAGMLEEVLSETYDVSVFPTAEQALRAILSQPSDLMVVDRRLPGMDGVSLIGCIRQARIRTPVLMLTALGTIHDRVTGLDGGANDYLVKPFDFDELLARLRALRRGFQAEGARRYIGQALYTPGNATVYLPDGHRATLTTTENELLRLLSDSPHHVYSRQEILSAVFSPNDRPGTVDTYVSYIRRKTSKAVIETVRSHGYRLGTDA